MPNPWFPFRSFIAPSRPRRFVEGRARLRMVLLAAATTGWFLGANAQVSLARAEEDEEVERLEEVVVTATRLPTAREEVASAMTVVTAEEIERKQYRTIVDVLRPIPGLNVVQQGGPGKQTSLFMRGSNANQTLVLVDGIEVNDPSSPNGAFDFGKLLVDNVARVEVLRGPQSTLYGSDAIGGVVNIITKKGEGPPRFTASAEAGSFATNNQSAGLHGGTALANYSFTFNRLETNSTSVTPDRLRPAGADDEADGFRNLSASGRIGLMPTDNLELTLLGRFLDTKNVLDVSPEDPNSDEDTQQLFLRAEGTLALFDGLFEQRLAASYTDIDRLDVDEADGLSATFSRSNNEGSKLKFEWQGNLYITDQVLTLGLETEEEEAESDVFFSSGFASTTSNEARTNAAYLQGKFSYFDRLFGTLGVRVDDPDRFESKVTYRITTAYLHRETGTKLKGTYGTGFKAPTLFQLFGQSTFFGFTVFSGNPDLQPEESTGWDIGFEQSLLHDRLKLGATYFSNDIDNLIVSSEDFTTNVNLAEAETWGVEAFIEVEPLEALSLRADYSYVRADDAEIGEELLRRPKNKASFSLAYRPVPRAELSLETLFVDGRKDIDAVTFARKETASYGVTNLAASYRLAEGWRLLGRIDNVFDRDFEDPDGAAHPGIGAFVGLAATF